MPARRIPLLVGTSFASVLFISQFALAQEPAPEGAAPAEGAPAEGAPAPEGAEPPPPTPGQTTAVADAEAGDSPVEKPGETYRFIGLRYRGIVVPKFMMNLFGDGGDTVYVHAFGPEFVIRKDAFEYNFSLWYAAYSMDPTIFKASSDGEDAWELVESKIKVLYLTADFLWSSELGPEFAFNYGLGAGFGVVFGELGRVQAYQAAPGEYLPCTAPGNPTAAYCGSDNEHYGDYTEPSWANGGSKPNIFPWLVFQTGFRYKPHRNFVARLDLGFGTSGFFFGIGADYGL